MERQWRIELLGQLGIRNREVAHNRFYSQKVARLLARLAYYPERRFGREELIEWLWPEGDLSSGRASLRNALFSLRRQLEPMGVPSGSVLVTDYNLVALHPATFITDVQQFETLCAAGLNADVGAAASAARQEERQRTLLAAVQLYRGDLLPGHYDDWVLIERERLRQRYALALQQLMVLARDRGDHAAAIDFALCLAGLDPLAEEANLSLLEMMLARGHAETAQRRYAEMWHAFVTALGEPPSVEAQARANSLGLKPPSAADRAARRTTPEKRVRSEIETPAQQGHSAAATASNEMAHADRAAERAAQRSRTVSLPPTFGRFGGRDSEIARLVDLLRQPATRLLTLTGAGGSGKTRLAIEVARRLTDDEELTVAYVPLADLTDAGLIVDAILDALCLPRSPDGTYLHLVRALGDRAVAVVLDNFEHLLAEGTPLVEALLANAPRLQCLVTSRQRLDLIGEREFPLAPLPTPEEEETPDNLMQIPSVQLLVDRARAVRPDFQVTTRNAAAIATICRRLDGLPLAIELAAARTQVVSTTQMLAELENRLGFLVSRRRNVAERHRSLRAALDWSYHLLTPQQQRFLATLSVFQGSWTLEAACAVCEETQALDLLEDLRGCSLISVEESEEALRFRMLETVREYCTARRIENGDLTATARRHVAYYIQLAETADPLLPGPEQKLWLDRLESEQDNLRAALGFCKSDPDGATDGLRLAGALWRFWYLRGYLTEGRSWLGDFLGREANSAPTRHRARALGGDGRLSWSQGEHTAARQSHEESLAIYRQLADRHGVAAAALSLGLALHSLGDYEAARALHQESLTLCRELRDEQGIAGALNNLANIHHEQGDLPVAATLYEECILLYRRLGNAVMLATVVTNLGILRYLQEDYPAARALHEEALPLRRRLGDRRGIAYTLNSYGSILRETGAEDESLAAYSESMALFRELGDRQGIGSVAGNLGRLLCNQGRFAGAQEALQQSLSIWRETGLAYKSAVIACLNVLARVESERDNRVRAARLFGAAAALQSAYDVQEVISAERERQQAAIDCTRSLLGEAAWSVAWQQGGAMSLEEAVTYALTHTSR